MIHTIVLSGARGTIWTSSLPGSSGSSSPAIWEPRLPKIMENESAGPPDDPQPAGCASRKSNRKRTTKMPRRLRDRLCESTGCDIMIGGYERIGKISETQILLGKVRYKSDFQNRYEIVKHTVDSTRTSAIRRNRRDLSNLRSVSNQVHESQRSAYTKYTTPTRSIELGKFVPQH